MPIVRNEDGFSSRLNSDPLALFNFNDPINYPYFLDDFLAYDDTQATGNPWTFTQTNGTDSIVGATGKLKLTLAGGDNDLGQFQLKNGAVQTNSKQLWFEAKVKLTLNDTSKNEIFVGLASVQTGANFFAADGLSITADDMLGFYVLDGQSSFTATMRENDVASTEAAVLTHVTATEYKFSIYYDGGKAYFYVDGGLVATLTSVDTTSVVVPTLYLKAGEAQANTMEVDYVFVGQKR